MDSNVFGYVGLVAVAWIVWHFLSKGTGRDMGKGADVAPPKSGYVSGGTSPRSGNNTLGNTFQSDFVVPQTGLANYGAEANSGNNPANIPDSDWQDNNLESLL